MIIADDNLYVYINGTLNSVDINTKRLVTYHGITGSVIALRSSRSYLLLPGM